MKTPIMSFKKTHFFSLIELSVYICLTALMVSSLFYSIQGSIKWMRLYKSQNKQAYESRRFQSDINKLYFFSLKAAQEEKKSLSFSCHPHFPDFFPSRNKKPLFVEIKIENGRLLLSIKDQDSLEKKHYYFNNLLEIQGKTTEKTLEITLSFKKGKTLSYLFFRKDFFK